MAITALCQLQHRLICGRGQRVRNPGVSRLALRGRGGRCNATASRRGCNEKRAGQIEETVFIGHAWSGGGGGHFLSGRCWRTAMRNVRGVRYRVRRYS